MQRYGADVTGGSEAHARTAAVRLSARHTVEVATTTAQDFWTWANHYPPGRELLDGIVVHRFPVASGRSPEFKDVEKHVLTESHTLAVKGPSRASTTSRVVMPDGSLVRTKPPRAPRTAVTSSARLNATNSCSKNRAGIPRRSAISRALTGPSP